jgi:hypothetical protein
MLNVQRQECLRFGLNSIKDFSAMLVYIYVTIDIKDNTDFILFFIIKRV